jgi:hypothetical protein
MANVALNGAAMVPLPGIAPNDDAIAILREFKLLGLAWVRSDEKRVRAGECPGFQQNLDGARRVIANGIDYKGTVANNDSMLTEA